MDVVIVESVNLNSRKETKMINKEITTEINNAIKYIWEYDIKQDYNKYYLLKEDTLKNALYFHLRNKC